MVFDILEFFLLAHISDNVNDFLYVLIEPLSPIVKQTETSVQFKLYESTPGNTNKSVILLHGRA